MLNTSRVGIYFSFSILNTSHRWMNEMACRRIIRMRWLALILSKHIDTLKARQLVIVGQDTLRTKNHDVG